MRSALTMFGIVIGVASVIILVSLLNGYMQNQLSQWADLGAKNINVTVVNQPSRSVSLEDMYAFRDANSTLFEGVSPAVSPDNGTLKVGSVKSESTTITGVSETYAALTEKTVAEGRFLNYADVVAKREVCVLGAYPAQKLFGSSDAALGQNVTLGGKNLQVVGVLTRKSKGRMEESGTDDVMLLPYSTALQIGRAHV